MVGGSRPAARGAGQGLPPGSLHPSPPHPAGGNPEGPGPVTGQLGAGPDDGPPRCWESILQFEAGATSRAAARRVVSSGCPRSWPGGARGLQGPPQAPRPEVTPTAQRDTAPAASSVHAGSLETQGSGPAAIRLQPTCSPRTDGRGCWGHRGTRQRTAHNTRLERRRAGESQVGPGPGPQGSPQIHTVTPTSAPEGGPVPNSTKPPSALASPAPTPTHPGAQQGHR